MPNSASVFSTQTTTTATSACSPNSSEVVEQTRAAIIPPRQRRHSIITQHIRDNRTTNLEDGGNQSDSSSNSNSSLASSPRYNERHPRAVGRKSGRGCGVSGCTGGSTMSRGSIVMLGSRTSLPPVNENCPLDSTESQLALNLRRATRSTSWTNQMILDTIDGLNTCAQELDPALGVTAGGADSGAKKESPRRSLEKFVIPKSISNLIMQSRSNSSVNPPTSGQNKESSCYNFLSGITEDEDEEQEDSNMKYSTTFGGGSNVGGGAGGRLTITTQTPIPGDTKRKHIVAGGEAIEDDPMNGADDDVELALGRRCRNGNVSTMSMSLKNVMIHEEDTSVSKPVISISSETGLSVCGGGGAQAALDKHESNEQHNSCSLYEPSGKKERPAAHDGVHFEDDDKDVIPPQ